MKAGMIAAAALLVLAGEAIADPGGRPIRLGGDPATWITDQDYPTEARQAHREGVTMFELLIDAQGKPFKCRIAQSSGTPALDQQACALLFQRGVFYPAEDANGAAIPASFTRIVKWTLDKRTQLPTPSDIVLTLSQLPAGLARTTIRVVEREDGSVESCVADPAVPAVLEQAACKEAAALDHDDIFIDAQGKRVRALRTWRVAFEVDTTQPAH